MGLLEVAIMFEESILSEKKFYEYEKAVVLDENIRDKMLSAVVGLGKNAFDDEIQNFALNNFVIIFQNTTFPSIKNPEKDCVIRIYGIVTKDTNIKMLSSTLDDALFQFVNRYSRIDIENKNLEKFTDFNERFEKIFKDFIQSKKEKKDAIRTAEKMKMQERAREKHFDQHRYSMGHNRFT
ncbi:MAG: hypothetical protein K9W44_01395 [Candidatus Lokiarchaeota archaeon]|nr:hypothetical protein [Candidatus Harpocratesius repetitus]